jgi:hypothetical protein
LPEEFQDALLEEGYSRTDLVKIHEEFQIAK